MYHRTELLYHQHARPEVCCLPLWNSVRQLKNDLFVQDVTCAPEPMAALCNEQQLIYINRCCCHPFSLSILGVDATFNLGEFNVTPMVYRHLLLENKKSGHPPLLLGLLLMHYQKQFRSYNYHSYWFKTRSYSSHSCGNRWKEKFSGCCM